MTEAVQSSEQMTQNEVRCPMEGCDYLGEPASVEGHISGTSDEAHSGKTGRDFRSQLGDQAGGVEDLDEFDSYPNVAGELESTGNQEITGESSTSSPTPPGIPMEIVVMGVIGLVFVWLVLSNPSEPTSAATSQEIEEEEDSQVPALGGER